MGLGPREKWDAMIRKVVQVQHMDSFSEVRQNLEYWLSRPPEERIAAVEELRREYYGNSHRLQRVARFVQQTSDFIANKRATGRAKDAADTEALGG
jgi:hypothetical protein